MARVQIWSVALLLVLLALVSYPANGDPPTYSECKPLIDATIMDLAAKAIKAGEEPSIPSCPPGEQKRAHKPFPPSAEPPSVPETEKAPLPSSGPEVQLKVQQEQAPPTVHKAPPPLPVQQAPPPPPVQQAPPPSPVQQPPPPPLVKEPPSPPPAQQPPSPPPVEQPPTPPPIQQSPPPPPVQQPPPPPSANQAPPSADAPQQKLSGFDKFMEVMFGYYEAPRNPKYTQPWNTHKEFQKKAAPAAEKPKKVAGPGIIVSLFNNLIGRVFKLPEGERDQKWNQPWQTHKEHAKKVKEPDTTPKAPAKPLFDFGFINWTVRTIFGMDHVVSERDPKWEEPWTTHKEHKKAPPPPKDQKPTPPVISKGRGGIFNYFVSLVFQLPKGERDQKWAEPWQTHREHKKAPAAEKVVAKKSREPGFISKLIDKIVAKLFGDTKDTRDQKWAEPWQTHKEHVKAKPAEKDVKPVKKGIGDFLGIKKFFNAMVGITFGKTSGERDPKWAQPWQTHEKPFSRSSTTSPKPPPSPPPQAVTRETPPPPLVSKPPPPHPVVSEEPILSPVAQPAPPPPPSDKPIPQAPVKTEAPDEELPKKVVEPTEKKAFPSHPEGGPKLGAGAPEERMARAPEASVKWVLEEMASEKESRKENFFEDEEQIVVIPSAFRPRDHIESILGLDEAARLSSERTDPIADATLRDLKKIYEVAIKPLETIYKYQDISNRHLSDAELFGTPLILLLGPYSTGKSTFINYLNGVEFTKRALKTGTPPSHGAFRIVKYGEHDRELDGTDLSGHWSFASLQKFGQNFIDQLRGKELYIPLLKKVTFAEAPGILEMRRPGERLYPFNDVVQWFIDRADLILVMFDYTKLDAGYELEAILDQLKGRESQTRILLNKADQVPPEELIKVQGSLFWNLSPLLGVSAPPIVYAGSFASIPYRPSSPAKLFQAQEEALLHDISKAVNSRVYNRIAIARRHAVRVRNHAQMVDTYLATFYRNKGFLTSKHKLAEEIIEHPHAYNIYEGVSLLSNISRYDLPDAEVYRDFFRIHNIYEFRTLRETCSYMAGCPLDKLDAAISRQLPELMDRYRRLVEAASPGENLPDANIRPGEMGGAKVAHAQHSK